MEGKITQWFNTKGYGFIRCDEVPFEIFAHATQFKNRFIRPKVGDEVSFLLQHNKARTSAAAISIIRPKTTTPILMIVAVCIVLVCLFVFFNYLKLHLSTPYPNYSTQRYIQPIHIYQKPVQSQQVYHAPTPKRTQFTCQGKTHCSHMRSYKEALFYLQNCPNTRMDGDGDGFPCEAQSQRTNWNYRP